MGHITVFLFILFFLVSWKQGYTTGLQLLIVILIKDYSKSIFFCSCPGHIKHNHSTISKFFCSDTDYYIIHGWITSLCMSRQRGIMKTVICFYTFSPPPCVSLGNAAQYRVLVDFNKSSWLTISFYRCLSSHDPPNVTVLIQILQSKAHIADDCNVVVPWPCSVWPHQYRSVRYDPTFPTSPSCNSVCAHLYVTCKHSIHQLT